MKEQETNEQCAIDGVSKRYGFKLLVDVWVGVMFVMNCNFWKTKYDNIYITNYNINDDTNLKEKDLSMLFYKKKGEMNTQIISNETLKDKTLFKHALDGFKNECSNVS